jgi:hypothetical protein
VATKEAKAAGIKKSEAINKVGSENTHIQIATNAKAQYTTDLMTLRQPTKRATMIICNLHRALL